MEIGNKVYIRGDLRINMNGRCAYHSDQLVNGKYIKKFGTDAPWVGYIDKIDGDMILVGGGWRHISSYEVVK